MHELTSREQPGRVALVYNVDGVATLFFQSTTTTSNIALFVTLVWLRFIEDCDEEFPPAEGFDAVDIYLHLVRHTLLDGYIRCPGVIGTVDRATGLPLVHAGIVHHPLRASYAAHVTHHTPTDSVGGLCVEAKLVNFMRGSWRWPTLQAYLNAISKIPSTGIADIVSTCSAVVHRRQTRHHPPDHLEADFRR